ncbi:MAG TPA: alginate lyase family protein [Burkholderiales bacterium]|nr:alginate lyase family protein [Burkholderiales bacterium]
MDATEPRNLVPDPFGPLAPKLKRTLRWRLNRLRCMTPVEVAHRALRAVQARAERSGLVRAPVVPPPERDDTPKRWVHNDAGIEAGPYLSAAERIAEGKLDVFSLRELDLGMPPRWNRDPKTGIEAPLAFGKLLDYRDPDLVGDIKYLWEPNRHLQLVTLAQAYALTGERQYVEALELQLDSWFLACPYGRGPNWSSALEAGLRLVNWSIAWQLAQPALDPEFAARWLRSVYEHAHFIRNWFSAHSSANNHLIGEAAGLFIAGMTWPLWREMREWAACAKGIVEREALAQNSPDGVNREQAVWYQQFVLDMLVLCLLAGKANGEWFSADYESRIEAMMDFIASIMDKGGNVPMFGDADDGYVVRLDHDSRVSPFRSALALGALLFRRGDFKLKAGRLDDKARWLLGAQASAQYEALDSETTRLPQRQTFPEGGYYILGAEFDTPNEIRAVVDAGPLGYTAIAAHGHADALSFTLSVGGREFLIDPGTYAYHTQERWRQYFRGTSAHNTVRIDARDQSEQGGNFLWLEKARAGCSLWLSSAEKDSFEGWHDGYMRLADPVKHRRLLELDKAARRLLVEDSLEIGEEHEVELFFHCAEQCRVDAVAGGYLVERDGIALRLTLPPEGTSELHKGSLAPVLGWVSRGFDRRQPAATIAWRAKLSAPALLRTTIEITRA